MTRIRDEQAIWSDLQRIGRREFGKDKLINDVFLNRFIRDTHQRIPVFQSVVGDLISAGYHVTNAQVVPETSSSEYQNAWYQPNLRIKVEVVGLSQTQDIIDIIVQEVGWKSAISHSKYYHGHSASDAHRNFYCTDQDKRKVLDAFAVDNVRNHEVQSPNRMITIIEDRVERVHNCTLETRVGPEPRVPVFDRVMSYLRRPQGAPIIE